MAFTVTIAPLTPTAVVGATTKFTATAAGATVEGTESFVWTVDGVPQSSVIATMDYIAASPAGSKVVKVVATTTPAEGEPETAEAQTTITVNNKTMTATGTLSTSTPTVKVGQEYKASANVEGAPSGATFDYLWSTGETTKDITRTATVAGPVSLTCLITVSATDYNNQTITPDAVVITVENNTFPEFTVDISSPSTATVDVPFNLTASINPAIPGATLAYKWDDNSTEATRVVSESTEGLKTYACEVTVSQSGFTDSVKTGNVSVTVEAAEPVVPEECPLIYVHPLPQRHSAYIWVGWWVMDAIQKLTEEGKDWKTATEADTPYYCHLAVLAKMLNDYPEVDVQESRNGYIVHRSALEAGIIYP
ncbi:hypothetical protein LG358_00020 [Escherichia phage UoN_LG358_1]|nr:hypothetical protein LG358_00020 [Escherichia phage UoN_LG358_1]